MFNHADEVALQRLLGRFRSPGEDLIHTVLPRVVSALEGVRADAELTRSERDHLQRDLERIHDLKESYRESLEGLQETVQGLRSELIRVTRERIAGLLPSVTPNSETTAVAPAGPWRLGHGAIVSSDPVFACSNREDDRRHCGGAFVCESVTRPMADLICSSVNAMIAAGQLLGVDPTALAQAMGGGELARVILRAVPWESSAVVRVQQVADTMDARVQDLQTELDVYKASREGLQEILAKTRTERDDLQAFKDYVHARLDTAGVDRHDEQNAINGCRIGARLDDVLALIDLVDEIAFHECDCPDTDFPGGISPKNRCYVCRFAYLSPKWAAKQEADLAAQMAAAGEAPADA